MSESQIQYLCALAARESAPAPAPLPLPRRGYVLGARLA